MSSQVFAGPEHVKCYAAYRPTYPEEVYQIIIAYCKGADTKFDFGSVLDIGCGSGQSTGKLTKLFRSVKGVDSSAAMIAEARRNIQGVEFVCGDAEDLNFLADESVDLVNVASALHWLLPSERFFSECLRIMKPGGVFVAHSYHICILDIPEASAVYRKVFLDNIVDPACTYIENHNFWYNKYTRMTSPFEGDWERDDSLVIRKEMKIRDFIMFVESSCDWQYRIRAEPGCQILNELEKNLTYIYEANGKTMALCTWPMFIIMGRKSSD